MTAWNNSRFNAAEGCARLDYWSNVARLKPTYEAGLPGYTDRTEGTLWHAMMAEYYGHMRLFQRAAARVLPEPDDVPIVLSHGGDAECLCVDIFANLAEAAEFEEEKVLLRARRDYFLRLFDAYRRRYETDIDKWQVLGIEQRFITVLGDACPTCDTAYTEGMVKGTSLTHSCPECEDNVDYLVGQADLIVRQDGVVRVVDHKTTRKSVSEWKLASYNEDSQFTHYLYGISRVRGEEIGNACANVVAKLVNIDERGNPFHRNDEIVRGSADFDAFVAERRDAITELRRRQDCYTDAVKWKNPVMIYPNGSTVPLLLSAALYPRSSSSCRRFGLCSFYGLCWPTRPDWWAVPEDLADSFEKKPLNYVDDYTSLIEEDVR